MDSARKAIRCASGVSRVAEAAGLSERSSNVFFIVTFVLHTASRKGLAGGRLLFWNTEVT